MTETADLSATEIADRVTAGQLSPVEVVEAALERTSQVNPLLNALVTLNPRALDDARILGGEGVGPLAGVPVGIKDVTEVAGVRTTFGSPHFAEHIPARDALVVERLRAADAIILGKTNTPEFAAGGNTWNDVFGRTRNPWNPAKSAGGSTGGGAAALATGMIALAEGTDLGGSLRMPASFCGVVGLRPSPGLVPTVPSDFVWDTLSVSGPMGRTAEDVALMLQAIAGSTPRSPLWQPMQGRDFPAAVRRGPRPGLRVAYCADITGIGIDPGVEAVCRRSAERLASSGVAVDRFDLDLSAGRDAFMALRGQWFASWMAERMDMLDAFGVNVRSNTLAGMAVSGGDLGLAEAVRGRIWRQFRDLFEVYDHLITPTMAVVPFPVELNYPEMVAGKQMRTYVDWFAPTFVLSLTGLPVASVPCGLDPDGMPVGMQIVGPPQGEEAVLALAHVFLEITPIGSPVFDA